MLRTSRRRRGGAIRREVGSALTSATSTGTGQGGFDWDSLGLISIIGTLWD
jgi:hypothetical protein